MKNPFSLEQWTTWLGATATAGVMITVFIFTTFDTKNDAIARTTEVKSDTEKGFDKIDKKLDSIDRKIEKIQDALMNE